MEYLEIVLVIVIMASICGGLYHLISKYTSIAFWEPFLMTALGFIVLSLANVGGIADKMAEISEGAKDYTSDREVIMRVMYYLLRITVASSLICILMLIILLICCGIMMIFSKRCRAELVKIEVPAGMHTSFAYYRIEDKVYQCALGGVSKKLVIGNEYGVRLNRLIGKVFDESAVFTCLVGFVIMLAGVGFFVVPFMILDF